MPFNMAQESPEQDFEPKKSAYYSNQYNNYFEKADKANADLSSNYSPPDKFVMPEQQPEVTDVINCTIKMDTTINAFE